MTTHFTSGVTNVSSTGTEGLIKQPSRHKYHEYFNDFDAYLASDWTITTTEAGTGSATEALGDGDGGLLVVTNAAGDNDHDFFQLVKEGFKYEADKQLAFFARRKTSDADASDVVAGLQLTDTTPLDVTDGIFFLLTDGSTTDINSDASLGVPLPAPPSGLCVGTSATLSGVLPDCGHG